MKVVTVTKLLRSEKNSPPFQEYHRVAIYEFRGNPAKAYFVEDLGVGSYHYSDLCRRAINFATELDLMFVPHIEVMDSIDKVYRFALKV